LRLLCSTADRRAKEVTANLDLILASQVELVRDVKAGVSLGSLDPETLRSRHPRERKKENSTLQMMNIRGADFSLFWKFYWGSHGQQH